MREHGITMTGGEGLRPLRERDWNLVDAADTDDKQVVGRGCWILEKWRVAELVRADGLTNMEVLAGGGGWGKLQEGMGTDKAEPSRTRSMKRAMSALFC